MKIALPEWQGRISPVFDVAARLLIAETSGSDVLAQRTVELRAEGIQPRANEVARMGVEVLVCGAISRPQEDALTSSGVEVIPQTCGEVAEVLSAFLAGRLDEDAFLMPGCCGRRRRGKQRIPTSSAHNPGLGRDTGNAPLVEEDNCLKGGRKATT